MGRDFWRILSKYGDWLKTGDRQTGSYSTRFDNPSIYAIPAFEDVVPAYFARREPPPAETGLATYRSFADNFLKAGLDAEILSFNPRPDRPFALTVVGKRSLLSFGGRLDLDYDEYRTWCAAHPNRLYDSALAEWDNDLMLAYERLDRIKDQERRREVAAFLGEKPKDRYARVERMGKYYRGRRQANYDGRMLVMSSHVYSLHLAGDLGAEVLGIETTNTSGGPRNDAEYRWNTAAMFARGAARQFDRPWEWYIASYMNGYTTAGEWVGNSETEYPADEAGWSPKTVATLEAVHHGPRFGQSASLLRRAHYFAYLNGANFSELEEWQGRLTTWDRAAKKTVLTPRAQGYIEFADFTRVHPGRGTPYTPVAICVPLAQGYTAFGGYPWEQWDNAYGYTAGDCAVDSVFFTLVPGFARAQAMAKGTETNLHNTPYAQMYDVICPDVRNQTSDELLEVMRSYRALVVVGDYPDRSFERTLARYEAEGGRVVRIGPDEAPLPEKNPHQVVADFRSGRLSFPKVAEILAGLQRDYFPFKVEGDCLYGANRTKNGWWLWFFNNRGVTKFADAEESVDPSARTKVSVDASRLNVKSVTELMCGRPVPQVRGRFEEEIPAADLRIFEIVEDEERPLPGEPAEKPAVTCAPFPDRMSAFVWRNWFLVPKARLAETVGAPVSGLEAIAAQMGLPKDPEVLPEWRRKGYITVLRRNWHLLDYDQLLTVLGMSREELRYSLIEDDFLFVKLGNVKPKCGALRWREGLAEEGREERERIARILKEEGADDFTEEPRFRFVKDLSALTPDTRSRTPESSSPFGFRMVFSYFADYGDPLMDPEVSSYPEGLLKRLSEQGVNAVYLHVVLRTLAKDPAYPEFGDGCEQRLANLRKLVDRAARYGVKVILYMNEPRSMEIDFFRKSPERMALKGVHSQRHVTQHALCTSVPEVRRWMSDSIEKVFRAAPGLGGIFTISADENLSNCASHWRREDCPRCAKRTNAEVIAEANAALIEGMRRADPSALAVVWDWGWMDGDFDGIVGRLPKDNVAVMTVSEWGIPVRRGGVSTNVFEYSLSVAGPGERAKRRFAAVKAQGLKAFAKVQASCSWEHCTSPYLPVMDIVARHAKGLADAGADGVMMSWSLGGYPSPNLSVFASCRRGEDAGETLDRLAAARYGEAAVPKVRAAWSAFSAGFGEFPFHRQVLYEGPQHWGPANPLYARPTGYEATMVGIPYDDLTHWRWSFESQDLIAQFEKTAAGFAAGVANWRKALELMPPEKRGEAERDGRMYLSAALHFQSAADQARFVLARGSGDRKGMRTAVERELKAAKRFLPLVRGDGRIGYECSNHYFYVPQDVREKIVLCRMLLEGDF